MRIRLVVPAVLVALCACGADAKEERAGRIEEIACDDGAACSQGFSLDGSDYALSCAAVRPDHLGAATLGTGTLAGTTVEARPVTGADPDLLIALTTPEGSCGETGKRTGLIFAIAAEAPDDDRVLEVICDAGDLTPPQRQANRCRN